MRSPILASGLLVLGLMLGWSLAAVLQEGADPMAGDPGLRVAPGRGDVVVEAPPSALPTVASLPAAAPRPLADGGRADAPDPGDGDGDLAHDLLIGPALRAHALEEARRGWREERDDELPASLEAELLAEFERNVLSLPARLGAHRARDRNERDAVARRDDIEALLVALEAHGGDPQPAILEDVETFAGFFVAESRGPTRSGGVALPDERLPDGATLLYPPGVFALDERVLRRHGFPADLTIAGAGRDQTLLILGDLDSGRDPLRRLRLQDCTVFTDGDYLTDQRGSVATLILDRVRLTGFDSGAGGSVLLATREAAIWARDCEVVGGYGRSPGSGHLMRSPSDGFLARFDRCTIARVDTGLGGLRRGAAVRFERCQLVDLFDHRDPLTLDHDGLAFPATSVTLFAGDEPPRLDLNDLFPDWEQRLEAGG